MFANNMLGMNLAFPCIFMLPTPIGPMFIPSVNLSFAALAVPTVPNVLMNFLPAGNLTGFIMSSIGAPFPGAFCGAIMGPTFMTTAAFTVLVDSMPMTRMTSLTQQNLINSRGFTVFPGQFTTLVLAP
jgi:hypothetical protein